MNRHNTPCKCPKCGSLDVEMQVWIRPNKNNEYVKDCCEDMDYCWCNNCREMISFEPIKEAVISANLWWEQAPFVLLEKITGLKYTDFNQEDGEQKFIDACEEYWLNMPEERRTEIWQEYINKREMLDKIHTFLAENPISAHYCINSRLFTVSLCDVEITEHVLEGEVNDFWTAITYQDMTFDINLYKLDENGPLKVSAYPVIENEMQASIILPVILTVGTTSNKPIYYICPNCDERYLRYAVIDLDGTNLDEGYFCENCSETYIGLGNHEVLEVNEKLREQNE